MTIDELQKEFLAELFRQQEEVEHSQYIIEQAADLYGPANFGAAGNFTTNPRQFRTFLNLSKADRLVTFPIWILFNVLIFGVLGILTFLTIMFGTALLMMLGAIIDAIFFDFPLARIGAIGVGTLSGIGSIVHLFRAFVERARNSPW